jgi:uncharacterized membrane protein YphA (DoxX/SURF4 family)
VKIVTVIARILLGLTLVVFGLNGFLNFIPGPAPPGLAGQFMGALVGSHYFWVVAALHIVSGALLLANRFVPLALTLFGPVLVNIISFHLFLYPTGVAPAVVVTVLWLIVFYANRQHFAGILVQRA